MSKLTFGEVEWNEGDSGNSSKGEKLDIDWMKLVQGKNKVRIMGNPLQTYIHWVENTEGKKRSFGSPVEDPALVQQLDEAGFPRKRCWYLKVLDRSDGRFKVLQVGAQIYDGVKELYNDSDWGPVTKYDITIMRGPKGQQPLYKVFASNKAPIEEQHAEAWEAFNVKVGDLSKLTQPAKPEWVREFLGWAQDTAPVKEASDNSQGEDEEEQPKSTFKYKFN